MHATPLQDKRVCVQYLSVYVSLCAISWEGVERAWEGVVSRPCVEAGTEPRTRGEEDYQRVTGGLGEDLLSAWRSVVD